MKQEKSDTVRSCLPIAFLARLPRLTARRSRALQALPAESRPINRGNRRRRIRRRQDGRRRTNRTTRLRQRSLPVRASPVQPITSVPQRPPKARRLNKPPKRLILTVMGCRGSRAEAATGLTATADCNGLCNLRI